MPLPVPAFRRSVSMRSWFSKIRTQAFAIGLLPLLFLLLVLVVVGFLQFRSERTALTVRHSDDVLAAAQSVADALVPVQRNLSDYVRTGQARYLAAFRRQAKVVDSATTRLRVLVRGDAQQELRAAEIAAIAREALNFEQRYADIYASGHRNAAAAMMRLPRVRKISDDWYLRNREFAAAEAAAKAAHWAQLAADYRKLDWVLGIGAAFGVLLTLLAARRFGIRVVERLEQLASAARRVQAGGDIRSPMHGEDEIANLDRAFYQMALELRQREAQLVKYRLLVEHARDIILFVRRSDGQILEANAAAANAYGYTIEEMAGMNAHDLRTEEAAYKLEAHLEHPDATGPVFETMHRRKNGSMFPVEVAAQSTTIHGEQVVVSIIRDVSERRLVQQELHAALRQAVEASRTKSEFVATMSHEIRTPMNAVIGMTELLLDSPLTDDQRKCALIVKESGEALLHLINDILDFSKIEANRVELDIAEFRLLPLIESIAALFAPQAAAKNVSLLTYVDPAMPSTLLGDVGRIRQILVNIGGNALKFTEKGSVLISAVCRERTTEGALIEFSVKDTGIGIAPDALNRLFEAFRQADGSMTRKYGGTGLGLSISKGLVELMGGKISVQSEPGSGSVFSFTLELPHSEGERGTAPVLKSLRALVLDDDPIARHVFSEYFQSWDMRRSSTGDPAEALAMLEDAAEAGDPFDVAIVDFAMPEMNGIEFGKRVRLNRALDGTRLIMVTAYDHPEQGSNAIASGFSAYLTKPVVQSQLYDCIANVAQPAANTDAASPTQPQPKGQCRILLAEDNAVNREVALRQFERLGCVAEAVADGREAVDAALSGEFDLIFMDCQMPNMDGFEATRAIRKAEARTGKRVRIVAMTANALAQDRDTCFAAGMDDYLSKPVTLGDLRRALQRATRESTLDLTRLNDLFDGDRAEIIEFLRKVLPSLERAVNVVNGEEPLERKLFAIHELKGAAANVGASELAQIALEAEASMKRGFDAQALCMELREAYGKFATAAHNLASPVEKHS